MFCDTYMINLLNELTLVTVSMCMMHVLEKKLTLCMFSPDFLCKCKTTISYKCSLHRGKNETI